MKLICRSCKEEIESANVNFSVGTCQCLNCNETYKIKELLSKNIYVNGYSNEEAYSKIEKYRILLGSIRGMVLSFIFIGIGSFGLVLVINGFRHIDESTYKGTRFIINSTSNFNQFYIIAGIAVVLVLIGIYILYSVIRNIRQTL